MTVEGQKQYVTKIQIVYGTMIVGYVPKQDVSKD